MTFCDMPGCVEEAAQTSLVGSFCRSHEATPRQIMRADAYFRSHWWDAISEADRAAIGAASAEERPAVCAAIEARTGIKAPSHVEILRYAASEGDG